MGDCRTASDLTCRMQPYLWRLPTSKDLRLRHCWLVYIFYVTKSYLKKQKVNNIARVHRLAMPIAVCLDAVQDFKGHAASLSGMTAEPISCPQE